MLPNTYLRRFALLFVLFILPSIVRANKFRDDDAFYLEHLGKISYELDKTASAIVLYEKTIVTVEFREHRGLVIQEEVRKIIKILKPQGAEYADAVVLVHHNRDFDSDIRKIRGRTYSALNGKLQQQEMDQDAVQKTISTNLLTAKFSLPAVREGSVIEYQYTVEKDFNLLFCFWEFQSGIPKLYSEAEVRVPARCNLAAISQNYFPFTEYDDQKKSPFDPALPVSYSENGFAPMFGENYLVKRWVRRNISAAFDEPFTGNFKNYTENLQLQLTGIESIYSRGNILDSWTKFNKLLYEHPDHYKRLATLNRTNAGVAKSLAAAAPDAMQKARAIFRHLRDRSIAKKQDHLFADDNLNQVYENRSGTPSELNLLLTAMLQEAGLEAEPVAIATKTELRAISMFPVLDRFNRTICRVKTSDTGFTYLDVSGKYYPFGVLPPECYNGYCRVVSRTGGFAWLNPDQLKERHHVNITTASAEGNRMVLNVKRYYGHRMGARTRSRWGRDTLEARKELTEILKGMSLTARLLNMDISNLDNTDTTLILTYSLALDIADADQFFLSPHLIRFFEQNPFSSAKRSFPVEMPSAIDASYSLQMQLPSGWELADIPPPQVVELDERDQYKALLEFDKEQNMLRLNSRLTMKRTEFEIEEYGLLKAFFDKVAEVEGGQIVIKKKS